MPRSSALAAFWNEILAIPKFPVCMGSLLEFIPNPVSVQTAPAVVGKLWKAPDTPENVPNSLIAPVPACGPVGGGLGAETLNALPNADQLGITPVSPLPTAVPVSNPGLARTFCAAAFIEIV